VTATFSDEDVKACRQSGMDDVLSKPVSFEALLRVLQPPLPPAGEGRGEGRTQ